MDLISLINSDGFTSIKFNQPVDENGEKIDGMFFDNNLQSELTISAISRPNDDTYAKRGITYNVMALESVWRSNPIVQKSVNWRASKLFLGGIDINSSDNSVSSDQLVEVQNKIKSHYNVLSKWAKNALVFGGAGMLKIVAGRMTKTELRKPLRRDSLKKGEFLGLKFLSRWYMIEPALDMGLIDEVGDKNGIYDTDLIGTPEYYRVNLSGGLGGYGGYKTKDHNGMPVNKPGDYLIVHRSWLYILNATITGHVETQVERFWSPSIIEPARTSLDRYEVIWSATVKSAVKNNIGILTLADLDQSLLNSHTKAVLKEKLGLVQNGSVQGLIPLGKNDKFEFASSNLDGNEKALRQAMVDVSNAVQVPISAIFEGVQEYNEENFLQNTFVIEDTREAFIRPVYEDLIRLEYKNLYGKKIGNFSFTFNSPVVLTSEQKANVTKLMIEVLSLAFQDNAISLIDYQNMLSDVLKNPSNIFNHLEDKYVQEILKGTKDGKCITNNSLKVELAKALNQASGEKGIAGIENPESERGKDEGGNPKKSKGVFKRNVLNPDKGKE